MLDHAIRAEKVPVYATKVAYESDKREVSHEVMIDTRRNRPHNMRSEVDRHAACRKEDEEAAAEGEDNVVVVEEDGVVAEGEEVDAINNGSATERVAAI